MMPINNSDTAWLIVSDYNQDNGKYYDELREDVYNPEIDEWASEGIITGVGASGSAFYYVGDITRSHVGCRYSSLVGSGAINVGCNVGDHLSGDLVGGIHYLTG